MPGTIPELSDIGPQLEGQGLQDLREEVRVLLNRRTNHFPGPIIPSLVTSRIDSRCPARESSKTTLRDSQEGGV